MKVVAAAATERPDALDRRVLRKVEENSLAVGGVSLGGKRSISLDGEL